MRRPRPKNLNKSLDPLAKAILYETHRHKNVDLTKQTGYSEKQLRNWRSGGTRLSTFQAVVLAEAMGLKITIERNQDGRA